MDCRNTANRAKTVNRKMSPLQNHGMIATTKGTVVFRSRIPLSRGNTILGDHQKAECHN
jgi:hypothetical protein